MEEPDRGKDEKTQAHEVTDATNWRDGQTRRTDATNGRDERTEFRIRNEFKLT